MAGDYDYEVWSVTRSGSDLWMEWACHSHMRSCFLFVIFFSQCRRNRSLSSNPSEVHSYIASRFHYNNTNLPLSCLCPFIRMASSQHPHHRRVSKELKKKWWWIKNTFTFEFGVLQNPLMERTCSCCLALSGLPYISMTIELYKFQIQINVDYILVRRFPFVLRFHSLTNKLT